MRSRFVPHLLDLVVYLWSYGSFFIYRGKSQPDMVMGGIHDWPWTPLTCPKPPTWTKRGGGLRLTHVLNPTHNTHTHTHTHTLNKYYKWHAYMAIMDQITHIYVYSNKIQPHNTWIQPQTSYNYANKHTNTQKTITKLLPPSPNSRWFSC